MNEIFIRKEPQVEISQVRLTGQTRIKIEKVLEEQENGHLLRARGLRPRYRLLFHGPAGTGKTLTAEAIAYHLGKILYIFNLEGLSGTDPDMALKTIMDAMRFMNQKQDVFLFDEFDAIAGSRGSLQATPTAKQISNALLIAFEQIKSNAILICGTNFISTVDPAFRRRFDTICKFELPSTEERVEIIKQTLRKFKAKALEDDIQEAALRTEGLSYHETEEVAISAIKTMILRNKLVAELIPEVPAAIERRKTFLQTHDQGAQ